jgi:hypothetical protein
MYVVTLPCNHTFRSVRRVVANMNDTDAFDVDTDEDAEDLAFLYCRTCRRDYAVEAWELEEYQAEPRDSAGRRIPETRLHNMFNDAVIKNRVAADLLKCDETQDVIAARHGVTDRTVRNVLADLRARRGDALDASGRVDTADPFDLVTAA